MSRGGRGGGRGGRRTGPDLSWEDDPLVLETKKPEPLFPELDPKLSVPRPLSEDEVERVNDYITARDSIRNGPYYAILEPNSFADDKGKVNERAGFDPFTGMEKYGAKFDKPKRTVPDFTGREYNFEFFPRELWSTLDPKRTNPAWRTRPPFLTAVDLNPRKRKAPGRPSAKPKPLPRFSSEEPSDADSDAPISSKRPKRTSNRPEGDRQKAGLEAEDDIPDVDANEDPDGGDDDEQVDTEFEDSEGGDYDAEQHFDDGMDDDADDGGDEPSYE